MSIRGLKLTQEILSQEPLRPFIRAERLPGPDVRTELFHDGSLLSR